MPEATPPHPTASSATGKVAAASDSTESAPRRTKRYRKVDLSIWAQEGFRKLSQAAPNGQSLWFYLLTGPHTSPVPGLSATGRAAIAERLGWRLRAFDRCWGEIEAQGMARADWRAGVVWLPLRIPANVNTQIGPS